MFGSVADVRRLLDQGLNPNAATKSGGTTALMAAAPDAEKMKLLLDRGASVNARAQSRFSALMVAAQYQDSAAAINLLLDRGADVGPPAEGGAPVFNANPFFLASYAGNADRAEAAARRGREDRRADDADRHVAHDAAARRVQVRRRSKWRARCSSSARRSSLPTATASRCSGASALNNEVAMARMLIDRGANVNVVDKLGMTPLLWAASSDFGDPAMIELLLKSGAKTDARNKDGLTALNSRASSATPKSSPRCRAAIEPRKTREESRSQWHTNTKIQIDPVKSLFVSL